MGCCTSSEIGEDEKKRLLHDPPQRSGHPGAAVTSFPVGIGAPPSRPAGQPRSTPMSTPLSFHAQAGTDFSSEQRRLQTVVNTAQQALINLNESSYRLGEEDWAERQDFYRHHLNTTRLDTVKLHTLIALPLHSTTKNPVALLHEDVSAEDLKSMAKLSQTLNRALRQSQRIEPQGKLVAPIV
mmetsp:Transcript_20943/g.53039  ORF Transcript_20943/g.53039 Transcript_20943/m.53039 type:complete len:183 (+) Transcript_20943:77-625(+)